MDQTYTYQVKAIAAGTIIGWRATPKGVPESDALVQVVNRARDALIALDDAVAPRLGLPNIELREAIAGQFAAAQLALAKARASIKSASDKLSQAIDAFERPAPVTGAADVALDIELRTWFDKHGDQGAFAQMTQGQWPELLTALARFQAPTRDAEEARTIYRELQRKNHPQRVDEFEQEQERITWARRRRMRFNTSST